MSLQHADFYYICVYPGSASLDPMAAVCLLVYLFLNPIVLSVMTVAFKGPLSYMLTNSF